MIPICSFSIFYLPAEARQQLLLQLRQFFFSKYSNLNGMILFDVCNESYLLKTAESTGWWVFSHRVQQMLARNASADVVKVFWNISLWDCCGDTDWNRICALCFNANQIHKCSTRTQTVGFPCYFVQNKKKQPTNMRSCNASNTRFKMQSFLKAYYAFLLF